MSGVEPIITGVVDLHHADHTYDLAAAQRAGLVAVIHKCTEGSDWFDPAFPVAMSRLRGVGLLRGAYHFARNSSPGETQADFFLGAVRALAEDTSDVLLALDLEGELDDPRTPINEAPTTMTTESAAAFVARIHERAGRWPLLYAGLSKLRTRMKRCDAATRETLGRCPLWLAAYGPDPRRLTPPAPWATWALQQYTNGKAGPRDRGMFPRTTPGFERLGQDRSAFRGTVEELAAWWATAGVSADGTGRTV